jgi:hypothetical protein
MASISTTALVFIVIAAFVVGVGALYMYLGFKSQYNQDGVAVRDVDPFSKPATPEVGGKIVIEIINSTRINDSILE